MIDEKELNFHPNAMETFREGGDRLLSAVRPLQPRESRRTGFHADRHPVISITDANVTHIRRETVNGLTMEVSEIALLGKDTIAGLTEEGIKELDKLAEAIQRTSDFRPRVSRKFVRSTILDWLEVKLGEPTDQDLPTYLLDKARSAVRLFEIWVPLANLALERESRMGHVRIRPISALILDTWFNEVRTGKTPDELELLEQSLKKLRAEVQGLAAAYIAVRAERQFAVDKALEKAEEVAAAFRLFHPANSEPQAAFYCRALGRESTESYSVLVVEDEMFRGRSGQMIPPYPDIWELNSEQLSRLEEDLSPIRDLLASNRRTEFQQMVLDSVLLYTRSTMVREPVDKLVFIFSAMESLLLKSETEPIQTHIADRLAFILGTSSAERKSIVRIVRDSYNLRSQFLHHGRTLEDFDSLAKFMMYAWEFFMRITKLAHQYATKPEFIEAIETRKYSGP